MRLQEEERLENYQIYIEKGKRFFNQITNYYESEALLNPANISVVNDNMIKFVYLYKPYLLELTYNEEFKLGQILVYDCEPATHFLAEPKFKLKEVSQIYFDYPGNIFFGESRQAHTLPSKSAESIIKEATK